MIGRMLLRFLSLALAVGSAATAATAQTMEFGCPTPGTTLIFDSGTNIVARGRDGMDCNMEIVGGKPFKVRALLIANHSGQIPIDAAIIGSAMFFDGRPSRVTRAMVEKWTATLPFVSAFFSRVGQVVGLQENAVRLLEMGELVLAFPEGMKAINKPFAQRYQLEPFGHGFMRLALRTQTPIVPVAVIGAEEQYLSFGNLEWAARALGLPAFPLVPQLLLPGGAMPLPTKYRLHFGEPMRFCAADGTLDFGEKRGIAHMPDGFVPWFAHPGRLSARVTVVCGHWSTLELMLAPNVLMLDSGCLWGGTLTGIRLDDRQVFQVPSRHPVQPKPFG